MWRMIVSINILACNFVQILQWIWVWHPCCRRQMVHLSTSSEAKPTIKNIWRWSVVLFPLPGFPNKEKKRLVYLAGTVPVQFQGNNFLCALHLCLERFRFCSVFSAHAVLFVYQWVWGQLFCSVSALRLGSCRMWTQGWSHVARLWIDIPQDARPVGLYWGWTPGPCGNSLFIVVDALMQLSINKQKLLCRLRPTWRLWLVA